MAHRSPQTIECIGTAGGLAVAHFPCDDLLVQESAACPVIIDHQHPQVDEAVIALPDRRRCSRFLQTHSEPEGRAFPQGTFAADLAAHLFYQLLGNREPEAGPAEFARGRRVALAKGFEKVFLVLWRDSPAGIADLKPELASSLILLVARDTHGYFADFGKFDRVAHEVGEHLS